MSYQEMEHGEELSRRHEHMIAEPTVFFYQPVINSVEFCPGLTLK